MEAFDTFISGVSRLKLATIKELFDDSEDKSSWNLRVHRCH